MAPLASRARAATANRRRKGVYRTKQTGPAILKTSLAMTRSSVHQIHFITTEHQTELLYACVAALFAGLGIKVKDCMPEY